MTTQKAPDSLSARERARRIRRAAHLLSGLLPGEAIIALHEVARRQRDTYRPI